MTTAPAKTITLTETQYALMPQDYRGEWTTERTDIPNWEERRIQYMGKRTLLTAHSRLVIEGMGLEIVPDVHSHEVLMRIARVLEAACNRAYLMLDTVQISAKDRRQARSLAQVMATIDLARGTEVVVKLHDGVEGYATLTFDMSTGRWVSFIASTELQACLAALQSEQSGD
ncbi:hypothetical protein VRRI112168_02350 [Vreelandella rituensis]|uniref:hypothetical protein n=1 Tax=Vreelandella rituensis TaxID=2282306 RepID=UPI0015F095F0|nr:hypothetical protein [Halomonas rituensis]